MKIRKITHSTIKKIFNKSMNRCRVIIYIKIMKIYKNLKMIELSDKMIEKTKNQEKVIRKIIYNKKIKIKLICDFKFNNRMFYINYSNDIFTILSFNKI